MGSSAKLLPKCFAVSNTKKSENRSWIENSVLAQQGDDSASKFLKIHIFDSKVDTDAVLDGHTISEHFLSREKGPIGRTIFASWKVSAFSRRRK